MKKIILSALAMLVAMTMSAITYQDQVSITLDDGVMYSHTMGVGESTDLSAGLNAGYYAEIQNLNEMPVAIYALYNGVKYSNIASNSFSNLPIGIKTNDATTYTLYFDDVVGTVQLYDKKLNAPVTVTEGGDYEFTVTDEERNSLINDRFYLNYNAAAFAYSLTTNAYGWATYSNDLNLVQTVPTGLKIYTGEYNGADALNLTQVDYVKANEGVVVYGMPNTTYYFAAGTGSAVYGTNNLKPTSAFDPNNYSNVFVLKGDALLEYVGTGALAANKAYLQLPTSAPAPRRINFVFSATEGVENVGQEPVANCQKLMIDGQVFIRRGNEVYNLQGQMVK